MKSVKFNSGISENINGLLWNSVESFFGGIRLLAEVDMVIAAEEGLYSCQSKISEGFKYVPVISSYKIVITF